jgi:FAD/FMN-containing dehydrogenase
MVDEATQPQPGSQVGLQLDDEAVQRLVASMRGTVLRAGQDGYDAARTVWNGMIDRSPALIVRCASAADVVGAVNAARDQNLMLAVRGGGHSVAGSSVCDRGLMIDLSRMRGIRVDLPAALRAPNLA